MLVQDGAVVQPAPATAQQLLSQHRGWSYTTALVRHQYEVLDWELHLQRLIRCVPGCVAVSLCVPLPLQQQCRMLATSPNPLAEHGLEGLRCVASLQCQTQRLCGWH